MITCHVYDRVTSSLSLSYNGVIIKEGNGNVLQTGSTGPYGTFVTTNTDCSSVVDAMFLILNLYIYNRQGSDQWQIYKISNYQSCMHVLITEDHKSINII